jgi:hypothetical protein
MCAVTEKKYYLCHECKDFPCEKIDKFFTTPEWHEEVVGNLNQIGKIGVARFLKIKVKQVKELINCAKKNHITHCSQCKNWPCEKLKRQPLVPD